MGRLRELDRAVERRWPRLLKPMDPLNHIYVVILLLVTSVAVSVSGRSDGTVFTAAALGLLLGMVLQMRLAKK